MSFDASYNVVFMVYRILGLVPFKFHFHSITAGPLRSGWRKVCWSFAENLWFACLLLYELYNLKLSSIWWYNAYACPSKVDTFNAFRTVMAVIFRLCIVITTVETYCTRHLHTNILSNLHEIDRQFAQKLKLQINYQRLQRTIFIAFLKWIPIYILAASIFIVNHSMKTQITIKYIATLMLSYYPLFKQALFNATYISYAILIRHRIQAMNQVLDSNLLLHPHASAFEI